MKNYESFLNNERNVQIVFENNELMELFENFVLNCGINTVKIFLKITEDKENPAEPIFKTYKIGFNNNGGDEIKVAYKNNLLYKQWHNTHKHNHVINKPIIKHHNENILDNEIQISLPLDNVKIIEYLIFIFKKEQLII